MSATYPRERRIGPLHLLLLFPRADEAKRYFEITPDLDLIVTVAPADISFLLMAGAERDVHFRLSLPEASALARITAGDDSGCELVAPTRWDRLRLGLKAHDRKLMCSEDFYVIRSPEGGLILQKRSFVLRLMSHIRLSEPATKNLVMVLASIPVS
jgi:hypothetical protein